MCNFFPISMLFRSRRGTWVKEINSNLFDVERRFLLVLHLIPPPPPLVMFPSQLKLNGPGPMTVTVLELVKIFRRLNFVLHCLKRFLTRVSKSTWFTLLCWPSGFKNSRYFFIQSSKNKTNCNSFAQVFSCFVSLTCIYFTFLLVHCFVYIPCGWLE